MKIVKPSLLCIVGIFGLINASFGEQNQAKWKTADDFKGSEIEVVRKSKWVLENPSSNSWGDSLQYILEWGNGVPYLTFEIYGPYSLKISEEAKKYRLMGRIGSMLLVGCIKYGIENRDKVSKKEMTRSSLLFASDYYKNIVVGHEDSRINIMETIIREINKDSLNQYINKHVVD